MSMTRKFTNTEKKFDKSEIVSDIMSVFKAKEPSEVVPEVTEIQEEERVLDTNKDCESEELEVVAETERSQKVEVVEETE